MIVVVARDFNAKLLKKMYKKVTMVWNFRYGQKKERGAILMNYVEKK